MKLYFVFAIAINIGVTFGKIKTVDKLDLDKYDGRWYEIYNSLLMSSTIQRNLQCTTEDYKMKDGIIQVKFTGREGSVSGKVSVIEGKAKVIDPKRPGELGVNFTAAPRFLDTTSANYLVTKLGPIKNGQYQYTVITSFKKAFLWVLARDVTDFKAKYDQEVLEYVKNDGFDWFWNRPREVYQGSDCVYSPF